MRSFFKKIDEQAFESHILAVDIRYLFLISGLLWSGVGLFLDRLAFTWLVSGEYANSILYLLAGLLLAIPIHLFGFSKVANKNIARIEAKGNRKTCIFAFQKLSGYLVIIFMMSLGIFMRNTELIPKNLLIILYLGIGTGLFLSSFKYYISFYKTFQKS